LITRWLDLPRTRRTVVVSFLAVVWIVPGAIATFQPASPFVNAVGRVEALARARPVDDGSAAFLDVVSAMATRVPARRDVAIWVERAPGDFGEVAHIGGFLYMATYLLYPRRVFPLATPDVIAELERRKVVAPPLAAVMRERASALSRGASPPLDIALWSRAAACASASITRVPGVRLVATLPEGACLFAAGDGAN
jgi:hypothetical protein